METEREMLEGFSAEDGVPIWPGTGVEPIGGIDLTQVTGFYGSHFRPISTRQAHTNLLNQ
jgi:hypothetical protein